MTTIDRRLMNLERAVASFTGPLVLVVPHGQPTPEQTRSIGDAKKAGRAVVTLDGGDALVL